MNFRGNPYGPIPWCLVFRKICMDQWSWKFVKSFHRDWYWSMNGSSQVWMFSTDLPGDLALKNGRDFLINYLWSPFPRKESTETPQKVWGNSERFAAQSSGQTRENFGEFRSATFLTLAQAAVEGVPPTGSQLLGRERALLTLWRKGLEHFDPKDPVKLKILRSY